jgi:hypothetical protein
MGHIAEALTAEREEVLEVIRALRELCENLADQLADLRWRQLGTQLGTQFDSPHTAYRALNRWEHEERARIEAAGGSRDDHEQEPPAAANVG